MAASRVLCALRAQGSLRILSVVVLGLLVVAASVPGLLTPYDPQEMAPVERLLPPSWAHPLGTDETGRDVLARILYGARVSVGAAVGLVAAAAALGGLVGLVAGGIGGRGEELLMRVCDLFLSFPQLLLAIGIVTVVGRGMLNCVLALAVVWWPQYARLMRGQVLVVRDREFVLAAHALGQTRGKILLRHLLPNCLGPLVVKGTVDIGLAMLLLSALSFLGLGVQPPEPDWGTMIALGRKYLLDYWWYPTFPGLVLFVTVLGFNVAGEWVREAL